MVNLRKAQPERAAVLQIIRKTLISSDSCIK